MSDDRSMKLKEIVKSSIDNYPDFPKPGILFRDVFSMLRNPDAYEAVIELLLNHIKLLKTKPDVIVALESRGFLFGPTLALNLKIPFVPIRKKGKLPGKLNSVSFDLEYGTDTFEIQQNSISKGQTVLIVDDLLATGGSLNAACSLVEQTGGTVLECIVLMELVDLKGRECIKHPLHSIVQF